MAQAPPQRSSVDARPSGERVLGGCELLFEAWRDAASAVWVGKQLDRGDELVLVAQLLDPPPSLGAKAVPASRALAGLSHPRVLATRKVSGDGELTVVTDFVDGESLRSLLRLSQKAGERVPVAVALRIAADYLEALAGLLEQATRQPELVRVIAGGVGPDGVVVSAGGEVRAAFFGAASRLVAEPSWAKQPELLPYRGPEQLTPAAHADARTAVFGVGALVYEMLAGRAVSFAGASKGASPASASPVARLDSAGVEAASEPLADWVARALERAPAARFQSPAVMRKVLRETLEGEVGSPEAVRAWVEATAQRVLQGRRRALTLLTSSAGPSGPASQAPATPRMPDDAIGVIAQGATAAPSLMAARGSQPSLLDASLSPAVEQALTRRPPPARRPSAPASPSPASPPASPSPAAPRPAAQRPGAPPAASPVVESEGAVTVRPASLSDEPSHVRPISRPPPPPAREAPVVPRGNARPTLHGTAALVPPGITPVAPGVAAPAAAGASGPAADGKGAPTAAGTATRGAPLATARAVPAGTTPPAAAGAVAPVPGGNSQPASHEVTPEAPAARAARVSDRPTLAAPPPSAAFGPASGGRSPLPVEVATPAMPVVSVARTPGPSPSPIDETDLGWLEEPMPEAAPAGAGAKPSAPAERKASGPAAAPAREAARPPAAKTLKMSIGEAPGGAGGEPAKALSSEPVEAKGEALRPAATEPGPAPGREADASPAAPAAGAPAGAPAVVPAPRATPREPVHVVSIASIMAKAAVEAPSLPAAEPRAPSSPEAPTGASLGGALPSSSTLGQAEADGAGGEARPAGKRRWVVAALVVGLSALLALAGLAKRAAGPSAEAPRPVEAAPSSPLARRPAGEARAAPEATAEPTAQPQGAEPSTSGESAPGAAGVFPRGKSDAAAAASSAPPAASSAPVKRWKKYIPDKI